MPAVFIHHGDHVSVPAPYALAAGDGAKVGALFGIARAGAASGAAVALATLGVWTIVAESAGSGQSIAIGAAVYWDDSAKRCTATAGGNTKIGIAIMAKATGDTSVCVRLSGNF